MPTQIDKRPASDADTDFARSVHHQAYRDVVTRQYGVWDVSAQDDFFAGDWDAPAFEIINCDGTPCGYLCVEDCDGDIHVREIVLLPEFQGRGIGSRILREIIERARLRRIPVRLGTHLANRAANLYRRLGFRQFAQTESHILFEWRADTD
ncbi:MAG TPA: GNAT family N-acetyltransferase [Pyrinomonadaceae bacterium]|nr:GNAT family N-acetyltransferase [Pyrinomonadaceae bacterium]